ncbi:MULTISPECIES: hypothetical protein [Nocardioides]|uniref:hypothetical protein n=1 Tax=Nocardioides TaxID=1839 RepID=UPI001A8F499E|nr:MULTISPECIES: hypothetical protein [Nocardioides]QSR30802.1 hypothetical protein CFI00_09920 [Nocardioides sp. S5]
MIVVNIKHSLKRLIDQVRLGIPDDVLLEQLESDTTTKWAGLGKQALEAHRPRADALYEHGKSEEDDYLVGVSGDQIVSVYEIRGWRRAEDDDRRVIFNVSRARAEMAAAVGQPTPGGPWKRGESRPIRYVDTQLFIGELHRRGLVAAYEDAEVDAVERRMVEVVRTLAGPTKATSPLDGVDLERDPRGGIRITVPMGTKVTIVQRDAS